jgi:hypothetical protein
VGYHGRLWEEHQQSADLGLELGGQLAGCVRIDGSESDWRLFGRWSVDPIRASGRGWQGRICTFDSGGMMIAVGKHVNEKPQLDAIAVGS